MNLSHNFIGLNERAMVLRFTQFLVFRSKWGYKLFLSVSRFQKLSVTCIVFRVFKIGSFIDFVVVLPHLHFTTSEFRSRSRMRQMASKNSYLEISPLSFVFD